jgi:hypothetical protein
LGVSVMLRLLLGLSSVLGWMACRAKTRQGEEGRGPKSGILLPRQKIADPP